MYDAFGLYAQELTVVVGPYVLCTIMQDHSSLHVGKSHLWECSNYPIYEMDWGCEVQNLYQHWQMYIAAYFDLNQYSVWQTLVLAQSFFINVSSFNNHVKNTTRASLVL